MARKDEVTHVRQVARKGLEDALGEVAHLILAEAIANAPGTDPIGDPDPARTLKELGHVDHHPWGWTVTFDGPYAAAQHERLDFEHIHGGQAKYLEHAMQTVSAAIPGIVAAKIRARLTENL